MLPREHTKEMVRIISADLKAEILIFPNRIAFSYPIHLKLPQGISRDVRTRLKRDLKTIHTQYKPRYTLKSFHSQPYAADLAAADLEVGETIDQAYIDTVNLLWYLGHQCPKCGGYRTDVGFDYDGNIVYQSLECGNIIFDKTQTVSSISWVTNLMGGEIE